MKCEHFVYGLYNGYGYILTKTNGVDEILTSKMLKQLCTLQKDEQLLWPPQHPSREFYISCSQVEPIMDEYKRVGTFNSTILMSLNEYLAYTQPLQILKPYFTHKTDKPPKNLKPLRVGA